MILKKQFVKLLPSWFLFGGEGEKKSRKLEDAVVS